MDPTRLHAVPGTSQVQTLIVVKISMSVRLSAMIQACLAKTQTVVLCVLANRDTPT